MSTPVNKKSKQAINVTFMSKLAEEKHQKQRMYQKRRLDISIKNNKPRTDGRIPGTTKNRSHNPESDIDYAPHGCSLFPTILLWSFYFSAGMTMLPRLLNFEILTGPRLLLLLASPPLSAKVIWYLLFISVRISTLCNEESNGQLYTTAVASPFPDFSNKTKRNIKLKLIICFHLGWTLE